MQENKLGVMPIRKLIWNMSLPIIASMLVQALYNVVDSMFVAMVSEEALTAVSLAFSAQQLMIGLASGTAVGVNALMGRALGAGQQDRADKVAINTAAIKRPELITEVANACGSQCMVLSIQAKRSRTWPGKWEAYYDNGRAHSGYDVVEWAKRGVELGAGEILLMSVDNEGLQRGMDLELIEAVTQAVNVPVICGGGVGCGDDIVDGAKAGADAVACAAVLHYGKETVQELKEEIRAGGVEVRR